MPRLDVYSRLFLVAAAAHVAGVFLGRPLFPGSGAIPVLALAGLVWSRPLPRGAYPWTKATVVAGLGLLAPVVDQPDIGGRLVGGVVAVACALIAAGVLGRVGRRSRPAGGRMRWAGGRMRWAGGRMRWAGGRMRWAGGGLLPLVVLALSVSSAAERAAPEEGWMMSQGITEVSLGPELRAMPEPVGEGGTHVGAALLAGMVLLGLATIVTSLTAADERAGPERSD